ncbi:hypothetical protein ACFL08_01565 [Patescibacteria group bacterium]
MQNETRDNFWRKKRISLNNDNIIEVVECLKEVLIGSVFRLLFLDIYGNIEKEKVRVVNSVSVLKDKLGSFILIKFSGGKFLKLLSFDNLLFQLKSQDNIEIIERRVPYKYSFLRVS